jgi:hypothetical protein
MSNIHNLNTPANPFNLDESTLTFPVTTRPLYGYDMKTQKANLPVDNHKGVYRAIDGQAVNLGVVGNKYKLLHNRDAYEAAENGFMRNLNAGQLEGAYVSEREAFNGGWTERVYTFPAIGDQIASMGGVVSKVGYQARLQNSYDGSASLRLITGMIDFYCDNGMILGSMIGQSKRRHTSGLTPQYVGGVITASLSNLRDEIERLQEMNRKVIGWDDTAKFIDSCFSERRAEKILDRVSVERTERGPTVWALVSALTYYASHNSLEFSVRDTGQDNVAKTLAGRADEVANIINGPSFRELMAA